MRRRKEKNTTTQHKHAVHLRKRFTHNTTGHRTKNTSKPHESTQNVYHTACVTPTHKHIREIQARSRALYIFSVCKHANCARAIFFCRVHILQRLSARARVRLEICGRGDVAMACTQALSRRRRLGRTLGWAPDGPHGARRTGSTTTRR